MKIKIKGKEYEIVDVITSPDLTTIFIEGGVIEIIGTDTQGDDFKSIMSSEEYIEFDDPSNNY